ncbi:MAG: tetratricopeptide repeat protein [Rhodocyclaceae bacterium]|nr:tetratricopeptide repeat protein [Rhodocyclaceae bacterium]
MDLQARADFAPKRFLVIDDFDGMRKILQELLRRCGARQVDTAANGNDAIVSLTRNKYDIVLCDYNLGRGKNGQQVLEEARQKNLIGAATIWAMITAEKTTDMVMGAAEHQPDDYLIKPLTEAMLVSRLSRLAVRKSALGAIESAVRSKSYLKAIELCDKRLKEEGGNDPYVVRLRCDLLMQSGNHKEARASFEKQLTVRETPWAMVGLAKLFFAEGDYEQARTLLERTLEDNRAYLEGYDLLARTLIQQGQWESAQTVLVRATTLSPNSTNRQQALGETSIQCKDLDMAEQAYRKAVTLGANSDLKTASPYLGLAKVHTEKGNTREALAMLGRLTKEVAGDGVKIQAKAAELRVHQKSGDADGIQACAQELAAQIGKGTDVLPAAEKLELAETLIKLGNKEVGSQLIQSVVRNHHEDGSLMSHAQAIFDQAEMAEEGATILESTRKRAVDTMDKGVRLAAQGDLAAGIEVLRDARALMPSNPRLLLNLAYLLITQMEKAGWHHANAGEARNCIETARKHSTDQQRCGQLQARLEKLGA